MNDQQLKMSHSGGQHKVVSPISSNASTYTMRSVSRYSPASPKSGPILLLSCLLAGSFYCCVVAAQSLEPSRIDQVSGAAAAAAAAMEAATAARLMREAANAQINDDKIILALMALKDFCASNPLECQPESDNCTLADDPLTCNPSARQTFNEDPLSYDQLSLLSSAQGRGNRTGAGGRGWDELSEGQSIWLPRLGAVESERNVGTQDNHQQASAPRWAYPLAPTRESGSDDIGKRLLNMLERYFETADSVLGNSSPSTSGLPGESTKASGKFKRDREFKQEQHSQQQRRVQNQKRRSQQHERHRIGAAATKQQTSDNNNNNSKQNKLRLTVEEAKRIIRAFRRNRADLARAASVQALTDGPTSRNGDLRVVPKRTSLSGDELRLDGGDGASSSRRSSDSVIITKTSGLQLGPELATLDGLVVTSTPAKGAAADNQDDDSLQCNMRRFIYRATKTDQAGNQCTGLITANICYGACDTGEIADWLFPHKKPIHKVCRHGGRIRRMKRLTECVTSSGLSLALDGAPEDGPLLDLQQYHYVDALDCVCKRCTSADTTCLGTMSRPSLPTLGEIGLSGDGNRNNDEEDQQQQRYRNQISSLGMD